MSKTISLFALCAGAMLGPWGAAGHAEQLSGAYIATTADCAACHTDGKNGTPFAGGYAITSPMGSIIASNITPSKEFGIGDYSLRDFSRAVREGVRKDGAHLYPAMPYPAYSKMSDADIAALYDYFMNDVAPVDVAAPQTDLPFPFSVRMSMAGWNLLYGGGAPLVDDPAQSPEWNRGRYLVEGPAHCGTCHTPRNLLMGSKTSAFLAGGAVGPWFAPNLTPGAGGLSDWSDADLSAYLSTGVAEHARASGPMAEAVEFSLQHLNDSDIAAIVTYLRTVPAQDTAQADTASMPDIAAFVPADHSANRSRHTLADDASGAQLYETVCASCHGLSGQGSADGTYPALTGNVTLEPAQSYNLISTILDGVSRTVDGHETLMPAFHEGSLVQPLSDDQVATVASYVSTKFGTEPADITAQEVATVRTGGPVALLVKMAAPGVMAAIGAALVLILAGLAVMLWRRKRSR
ncbi:hypothetical protein BFP70_11415 [Thioclava sp. SK-1]|nr:hypothetical protein BFP70_11415 [Thioclava sp. SK-1]